MAAAPAPDAPPEVVEFDRELSPEPVIKNNQYPFTLKERFNQKHFLPLNEDYLTLYKNVIEDEKLVNSIFWTMVNLLLPEFMLERFRKAPHKKWNWWWICKNFPLDNLLDLCAIDGVELDMDGVSANTNLTVEFYNTLDREIWKFNNKYLSANPAFTPQQLLDMGVDIDNHYLSKNPNLTREFVDAHDEIKWNIRYLTMNPGTKESFFKDPPDGFNCYINYSDREEVTPEFYLEHRGCFFNWNVLAERFPFEFIRNEIETNPDSRFHNCWNHISMNPSVTWEVVQKYPDYPWCYRTMCFNPSIQPQQMKERYDQFVVDLITCIKTMSDQNHMKVLIKKPENENSPEHRQFMKDIAKEIEANNPDNLEFYFDYLKPASEGGEAQVPDPDFKYKIEIVERTSEWDDLLKKESITIDIIKDYIGIRQYKRYRSQNSPKFLNDASEVMAMICNDVNWYNLTHNPNTNIDFVVENADKPFNWKHLSRIVDTEFIKKYPSVLWDMEEHSEYADVTLEYVEANKDLCWSWRGLSRNKNFDCETIWKNKDKGWYWYIVFSVRAYNNRCSK